MQKKERKNLEDIMIFDKKKFTKIDLPPQKGPAEADHSGRISICPPKNLIQDW